MIEPKRYKAQTLPPKTPDPFAGFRTREVTGYYVKHVDAQVNPLQPSKEAYDQFIADHTKHYIFVDGWADWNMPIQLEYHEIDISTLEEIE